MSETETPESPKKLPFDEAIISRFRDLIHELLTDHPELRTVGIVLDWNGPLNDAAIKAGLWICEDGGVATPVAIAGSINQTMKLLVQQVSRMSELEQGMREELAIIGQALVRKRQELIEAVGEEKPSSEG